MQVVNISHDNLIITEFNGKRFVFRRNIPVEISPEMYQNILLSKHISAAEIVPYEKKEVEEAPGEIVKETIVERVVGKVKEKIHPKGKKKR